MLLRLLTPVGSGQWVQNKDENIRQKKEQVETLMKMYPHLRVAYVDENKEDKRFFSCLVRWCQKGQQVVEVYRVELPGHILIGEGAFEQLLLRLCCLGC